MDVQGLPVRPRVLTRLYIILVLLHSISFVFVSLERLSPRGRSQRKVSRCCSLDSLIYHDFWQYFGNYCKTSSHIYCIFFFTFKLKQKGRYRNTACVNTCTIQQKGYCGYNTYRVFLKKLFVLMLHFPCSFSGWTSFILFCTCFVTLLWNTNHVMFDNIDQGLPFLAILCCTFEVKMT